MKGIYTLEDFNVRDKTVLLRVDINCPLDRSTLEIINDSRIRRIVPTVRELMGKRAKVIVLAHQSRKGKWDFTPLDQHSERLSRHLNVPVRYVNDIIGDTARKAISDTKPGTVLLLGNVREIDSESKELSMMEHSRSEIVSALAPQIDFYVNDAFAAAHRSQCSLVGFQPRVPSASGRLMAKELYALSAIFDVPRRPSVFILGGAKIDDAASMVDHVLGSGIADTVILAGLAGIAFLKARGVDIGEASSAPIKEELTPENMQNARDVMSKYGHRILLPTDVAVERNGKRQNVLIGDMPNDVPSLDIGDASIAKFAKVIATSRTTLMSGPAGMYEKEGFDAGTKALMEAMIDSGGQSVIGGGHTVGAADKLDLTDRFSYVSTGGGALEAFLLGQELPVVEALKYSFDKVKV